MGISSDLDLSDAEREPIQDILNQYAAIYLAKSGVVLLGRCVGVAQFVIELGGGGCSQPYRPSEVWDGSRA